MDKRLLSVIICPACRGELEFRGESSERRLLHGEFRCGGCDLTFPVTDEVPILVPPGTSMDGARWEGHEAEIAEWVPRNFERARRGREAPLEREFIEIARNVDGIVLDVASGPGGSFCVQVMQDSRTDRLLVMNDLGTPVMLAWRKHLQQVGWDNRCSNLVFDVRRTPFRDGSVAAITSVGGFNNIFLNRPAYAEAARVLSPGGQMLDLVRLYEEGGPTQQHLTKVWQAAATWSDYMTLLEGLGFVIQRWGVLNTGRGKTCPGDGLPLGDEAWEHRVVFAVQR